MRNKAFIAFKKNIESYSPISNETWSALKTICKFRLINKHHILYQAGEIPTSYSFVYSGLLRNYITDEKGNEYNKIFFNEGTFPGSMAALLNSSPSRFTIEALEPSSIIEINFKGLYETLRQQNHIGLR